MVIVTALKSISYEIPKSPTTALRSVKLAHGQTDSMTTLEYNVALALLIHLKASGYISYTPPPGDGSVGPLAVDLGNLTTALQSRVQGFGPLTVAAVGNFASGGSVGLAPATVDANAVLTVAQTTASQTLTLPAPTAAASVRKLLVANIGSASFTMYGSAIAAGATHSYLWNGSAWMA